MPLKRTKHWATREYHQFLLQRAHAPFRWGANDCCLFPADAIKAFTGTDIAVDFRGKYNDQPTALAAIRNVTGGHTVADAAAWAAKKHGLAELQHPLMAQRGDLVVLSDSGNIIAGIIHLNGRHVVAVGEQGLKRFSISTIQRAWRV